MAMSKAASGLPPDEQIRIVLVGKTGSGKSTSGNTLLNREAFQSEFSPDSVTSECGKAKGTVHGRKIAVIDTPGIFNTKYKENKVVQKLKMCISLSAPGPHAFLIVIKLGRFTDEEQRAVELLQQVFGHRAADYSLILFTHGDQLRGKHKVSNLNLEEFIKKSPKLSELVDKCNGRYHVFNNKMRDCDQVQQLLEKIEEMVNNNGGSYFTNEMYQEAERAIEEEIKSLSKENEAIKAKLENMKSKIENIETKIKTMEAKLKTMEIRKQAERQNKFIYLDVFIDSAILCLNVGQIVFPNNKIVTRMNIIVTVGALILGNKTFREKCITQ